MEDVKPTPTQTHLREHKNIDHLIVNLYDPAERFFK